jgi:hypothetical protein
MRFGGEKPRRGLMFIEKKIVCAIRPRWGRTIQQK